MLRFVKSVWYVMTLNCGEAERLRASGPIEDMAWPERVGERIHRGLCSACRRTREQLESVGALVEKHQEELAAGADAALPTDARRSLQDRLAAELQKNPN